MPSASSNVPTPAISAAFGEMPDRFFLGGGGGGLARALHRVHEDDGVHEGKAGIAAPLPALEAVALVGRQHSPAGGALVARAWTGEAGYGAAGSIEVGLSSSGSRSAGAISGWTTGLGRIVGRVHSGDPGDCRGASRARC